ncbi:hypothetical protein Btru_059710 [Bulinus truncatus]|nr:hypothetical protein Btru_059710 [Bulinus truncatus]
MRTEIFKLFKFSWITFISTVMLLPVSAVEVTSSFIIDNILGQTAILQCTWNVIDIPSNVFFYRNISNLYFTCGPSTGSCERSTAPTRFITNTTSAAVRSISMIINSLECSDEGVYKCHAYKLQGVINNISESTLNLKVLPTLPTLSNFQASVQENYNITATCTAIVGFPTPLRIVWKTFGYTSDLSSELVVATNDTTPAGKRCAVSTQSTVYLKASRAYKNLTLACFVTNQDSQPESCNNQTSLCSQTSSVNVLYPISNVQLSRPGTLYEGNSVTLSCYSDGNPSPTYNWTKVGDENTTLTGAMDGSSSTLTLTNLNISDSGTYNCTASNTVNGLTKVFSYTVNIIVHPQTTTTSSTTSTTNKKPTLITSTTSPGTNPADACTCSDAANGNDIHIAAAIGGSIAAFVITICIAGGVLIKIKYTITIQKKKPIKNNPTTTTRHTQL